MQPTIQANDRITYLKDLPEAVALHNFIQELDVKYKVDSSDPDNTFGRVFLDKPIVQYGVENTLFFANIDRLDWRGNDNSLPKYQAIPKADSVIILDNDGQPHLAVSKAHVETTKVPVTVDKEDLKQLQELRHAFKNAVKTHTPKMPDLSNTTCERENGYVDQNDEPIPYERLGRAQLDRLHDRLLHNQGFADNEHYHFIEEVKIPMSDSKYAMKIPFRAYYRRLEQNRTPYFATTFDGCQNQEQIPKTHPAYAFYKKWNIFHTSILTIDEWLEMRADLDEVVKLSKSWQYPTEQPCE